MKNLLLSFLIVSSFTGFAANQFAVVGDSCWKCVGGSFKAGQIECTPEATARLYEVNMDQCGSNPSQGVVTNNDLNLNDNYYAAPVTAPSYNNNTMNTNTLNEINSINNEIQILEQKLSRLKAQTNSL